MNSWGTYLVASSVIVLIVSPLLSGAARASREGADWRETDGLRAVLDGLRPGLTVDFSYGTSPSGDRIHLGGVRISCNYGSGAISLPSRWILPDMTLSPAVGYVASIRDGQVVVFQIG
jgi:hypothetical protein